MAVKVFMTDVFDFNMDVVMQQCNTFAIQGRGIAKIIKRDYPEAFKADKDFEIPTGEGRLGKFSWAWTTYNDGRKFRIFNLYGQNSFGTNEQVHTKFDKLEESVRGAFEHLSKEPNFKELRIGVPYGLGSANAAGVSRGINEEVWNKVRDIFERVSDGYGVDVFACMKD